MQPYQKDNQGDPDLLYGCTVNGRLRLIGDIRKNTHSPLKQ